MYYVSHTKKMDREKKENAICLSATDVGEYDKILTLLSVDRGLIRAKIKGVKKPKAKLAFCSFPFSFGEYIFVCLKNSNTVINCTHHDSFFELTYDLNKYYAGASCLEVTKLIAKENQPCTGLFVSLLKSLQNLCYTDIWVVSILAKYMLDCLEFCGFTVGIDVNLNLEKEVFFNTENALITNQPSEDSIMLANEDAEGFVRLLSGGAEILDKEFKVRKNLLKIIVTFFEIKVDDRLSVIHKFIS